MSEANFNEIATLLHIHKETLQHGPGLSHITAMAYNRLREINEEMNPHKPSTHVQTAFDKEVPPRNAVPEPKPVAPKVIERVPDGELKEPTVVDEPVLEEPIVETPVVERRDL